LNGLLYFETVACRGTITRAAEELSISSSAVSQQIKLLEQQLGLKPFRQEGRHPGKTQETHRLSLRVTPSFGVRWLAPRLSGFVARHPDRDPRVDAAPDPIIRAMAPTSLDRHSVPAALMGR
jgi:LysR family glycine cleavage system transcriptional activator